MVFWGNEMAYVQTCPGAWKKCGKLTKRRSTGLSMAAKWPFAADAGASNFVTHNGHRPCTVYVDLKHQVKHAYAALTQPP